MAPRFLLFPLCYGRSLCQKNRKIPKNRINANIWKGHVEGKTQISNLRWLTKVQVRQEIVNEQVGAWEGINDLSGYFDWVVEVNTIRCFWNPNQRGLDMVKSKGFC